MRKDSQGSQAVPRPAAFRVFLVVFRFIARMAFRVFSLALCFTLAAFFARTIVPDMLRNALGYRQAREVSITVLREELLAISELATYEFDYVNHVDFTNQPQLLGQNVLLTDHWFAFDYHGTIKAGYDLEQVGVLWIDSADQTIGISLPEVAVFSNEIYVDMPTYQDRNNICNPLQPREVLDFLYSQQAPELEKALSQNLLGLAEENAMRLISLFIDSLGYSAVFCNSL